MKAESIFAVVGLLWPIGLTVCMALWRWKRLQSKLGFLVLGALACFGLQAFLARSARYLIWTYFEPVQPRYYAMAFRVTDPIVTIVASALLSVPLLLWISALLGVPLISNDRSRGP